MGIEKFYNLSNFSPDWYTEYNCNKTLYLDGSVRMYFFKNSQYQFSEEGKGEFFPEGFKVSSGVYKSWIEKKLIAEDNFERSIRRSKRNLKDYVLNNHLGKKCYFVTLTNNRQSVPLSAIYNYDDVPSEITSCWAYDDLIYFENSEFKKRVLKKMNNLRNKFCDFQYILIPEFHRSGYVHFHGFFFDFPDDYTEWSGVIHRKSKVYNLKGFEQIGHTEVTVCRSVNKASSYATKYITKEMATYKGWQRYYISSGIKKPDKVKDNLTFDEFSSCCDWIKDCGNGFVGFKNL